MSLRFKELRLRLVSEDELDHGAVQREFPGFRVEHAHEAGSSDLVVDDHTWRGAFDLRSLDEKVERAAAGSTVAVRGYDVDSIAREVASRYQRFVAHRNAASSGATFDAVLRVLSALYESAAEPLVAEIHHAVDTWQWLLRLDREAPLATQLAALFHDLPRLDADARERIEHRVLDGDVLEDPRTRTRVRHLSGQLVEAGVPAEVALRTFDPAFASRGREDEDAARLDDAEALSFLSLGSAVYCDIFGVAQTRRKVAYTLSRLGPVARAKLRYVRLRPDVERLVREVAAQDAR